MLDWQLKLFADNAGEAERGDIDKRRGLSNRYGKREKLSFELSRSLVTSRNPVGESPKKCATRETLVRVRL